MYCFVLFFYGRGGDLLYFFLEDFCAVVLLLNYLPEDLFP